MRALCLLLLAICASETFIQISYAQQHCSGGYPGRTVLTARSGVLSDHEGPGNYMDNSDCWWSIRPTSVLATDRIHLEFKRFDTEYGFDHVWVVDGSYTGPVALFMSGSVVPQRWESTTSEVTIIFQSDVAVTRRGFEIEYHVASCPAGCSGNGVCQLTGVCACNPGFTGPECSLSVCAGNCSEHGFCDSINNVCVCEPGFYGGDCANPYCQPLLRQTADSGSFSEHNGGGDYLNNMECAWEIDPDVPASAILLDFDSFDLEQDFDFLAIFDGFTASAPLLANFSGHSLPPRITARSGGMRLEFTSDQGVTNKGFRARYRAVRCPGDCAGNGWCIDDNLCHCIAGWGGANCSTRTCSNDCQHHGVCEVDTCRCDAGWSGLDCGICDQTAGTCTASGYCAGARLFSTNAGTISDHVGTGDYQSNADCSWIISPEQADATNLVIQFRKVDVKPGAAQVVIYDGDKNANHVIGQFSGSFANSELPPVVASGVSGIVRFTSNSDVPEGSGFTADYRLTTCPEHCSYQGHCDALGVCQCRGGYAGVSCNETVCVGDCGQASNTGSCVGSTCVCESGWFGPDCSQTHCSGVTRLSASSGDFSDHGLGATYQPNSRCEFVIDGHSSGVSLFFPKLQLFNATVDILNPSGASLARLNPFSYTRAPTPFRFGSGEIRVVFTAGAGSPGEGFDAVYSHNSECGPTACSGRGSCLGGDCYCDVGYEDASCSSVAQSVELLTGDLRVTRNVSTWRWRLFRVITGTNVTATYLAVKVGRVGNNGNPEFYIREGALPSRSTYDNRVFYYYPAPGGDPSQLPELRFRNPKPNQEYFIGVFDAEPGTQESVVSLEMTYRCASASCSGHGTCITAEGRCVCDDCWTGPSCAEASEDCSANGPGVGLVIILLLFLMCACFITVAIVSLYKRNTAYYTRLADGEGGDESTPWWAIVGGPAHVGHEMDPAAPQSLSDDDIVDHTPEDQLDLSSSGSSASSRSGETDSM